MAEAESVALTNQPTPEANRVVSTDELMPKIDQAASQGTFMLETNQAVLYIKSTLPCDSGQDVVAHSPHLMEVSSAHCTGGYITFGPCWLEGAHQTMDLCPGSPGPPQSQSGLIKSCILKRGLCQVNDDSTGLQHPLTTAHHMFMSRTKSHGHEHLNHIHTQ